MGPFVRYAGAVASLVIALLAVVIVPRDAWDSATFITLLLLACAAALPLAAPRIFTGHGKSETGNLATIGISGSVLSLYFILSAIAFALAASGINRTIVWIVAISAGGWLAIGTLISRGSIQVLDDAFPNVDPARPTRSMIINELSLIRSSCPAQFTSDLDRLIARMRYVASDMPGVSSETNETIIALLRNDLTNSCHDNDPSLFQQTISRLEERISAREVLLKGARSKA